MANYKGMDANMQCRGFQYEVGKTYKTDVAELCNTGFHACEFPLDVFGFYPPSTNRFFEVEQGGKTTSDGGKTCSTEITIMSEIGLAGIAAAAVEYIKQRCADPISAGDYGAATADDYGAATAGNCGAATAGYRGTATAGDRGTATAGDRGAATAGDYGAATAGCRGAATAGYRGTATAGNCGVATAGNCGVATAGDYGAATSRGTARSGEQGYSVARGATPVVSGGLGAVLVCVATHCGGDIKFWRADVVDGKRLKADTPYTLNEKGEWEEAKNG